MFLVESVEECDERCFEYICTEDLLISLAVCWKGTLAEGGLHFLSVSVLVSLLRVDIGST